MACSSPLPPEKRGLQTLSELRSRSCSDAVASSVQATSDHTLPEKTLGVYSANGGFPWSNAMLQRQRTGFHFQPEKNYMNGTTSETENSMLDLLHPIAL
ncbi:hypothetical protein ZWY2020_020757 [Hordeum vulgare]|nr:hypothetical protein ZWY2020_020757 [Hordeum vulgare]